MGDITPHRISPKHVSKDRATRGRSRLSKTTGCPRPLQAVVTTSASPWTGRILRVLSYLFFFVSMLVVLYCYCIVKLLPHFCMLGVDVYKITYNMFTLRTSFPVTRIGSYSYVTLHLHSSVVNEHRLYYPSP